MDIQGEIGERESPKLEYWLEDDAGGMVCESKADAIAEAQENFPHRTMIIWEHEYGVGQAPILLWTKGILYEIGAEVPTD